MLVQNPHGLLPARELVDRLRSHWAQVTLALFVVASFLLKVVPLLQHPTSGGDPLVHYEYSLALLNGKLSIPVETGSTGNAVELYYPPLFHLISLAFFIGFPHFDPFAIMKTLACAMDALQMIPAYLIVKRISGSDVGGLAASYALLATRNDYQMLSWGGYANIAGLLLASCLAYAVLMEKLALSGVFAAALGLTHHLSTLFMIAVLVPYFALLVWRNKRIPKSLVGVIIGGGVAYVTFYQFAWQSIYFYYSNFSPLYDQGLYMTQYILVLVEPSLLISAVLGLGVLYVHERRNFLYWNRLLLIWVVVPFLLAYAYLVGVQWHGVRWIAFIPQPLAISAGIGLGSLDHRRLVSIAFVLLFTIQLFLTIQGYQSDILNFMIQ
jgi:hypothetical protein